jgi:hypothetical protein
MRDSNLCLLLLLYKPGSPATLLRELVPIQLLRCPASTYAPFLQTQNANSVANYHGYYQILIESGTASGAASNA